MERGPAGSRVEHSRPDVLAQGRCRLCFAIGSGGCRRGAIVQKQECEGGQGHVDDLELMDDVALFLAIIELTLGYIKF